MDVRLPDALRSAVQSELALRSRNALARDATRLSRNYRQAGATSQAVFGRDDALAYALSRMPATYAATAAALGRLAERRPDFAPVDALDVGAGPGTASWAMAQAYASLRTLTLIDGNAALIALGRELLGGAEFGALRGAQWVSGDLRRLALGAERFDLIVVSYALTELAEPEAGALAERLFANCAGALVLVEPGTPRDYARLMAIRARLIGLGARVVAPCPHEAACPLAPGDWCHFNVRLPRGRDHRLAKGASAPFEDEKFAYLIVEAGGGASEARPSRVLRAPQASKHDIRVALCAADGLRALAIRRRDAAAYAIARKLRWGDAYSSSRTESEIKAP